MNSSTEHISKEADRFAALAKDITPSIVDILERALTHFRKANKLDELRELSKPTDGSLEVLESLETDQAIRRGWARFSAVWFHKTESLIALYRDVVSELRAPCDHVDRFVQRHAEEHFNNFDNVDQRYLNTSGFGVFDTQKVPLRLPSTVATPPFNPPVGLIKLPAEILTLIFSLLCPTSGYGRGALALTSKYLATVSKLVPAVYRTRSIDATGATVSLSDSDTHRYCLGCGYQRYIDPASWQPRFTTIRELWYPCGTASSTGSGTGNPNTYSFNKSVEDWRQGRQHSHIGVDDWRHECFTRIFDGEDQQIPLCPICAAQHSWEVRFKHDSLGLFARLRLDYMGDAGKPHLKTARDALLYALEWRKEQFLKVFPAERGVFGEM